jgi:hypothetical protein
VVTAAILLGKKVYLAQLAGSVIIFVGYPLIHKDKHGAVLTKLFYRRMQKRRLARNPKG